MKPLTWPRQFKEAHFETKLFIVTAILFGALMVASTVYCYARIEFSPPNKTAVE